MAKKIFLVFSSFLILFTSVFVPVRKVDASIVDIMENGGMPDTTKYLIEGLLIVGGGGLIARDIVSGKTEEIYNNLTESGKQLIADSVDFGKGTISLTKDLLNVIKDAGLASWAWLSGALADDVVFSYPDSSFDDFILIKNSGAAPHYSMFQGDNAGVSTSFTYKGVTRKVSRWYVSFYTDVKGDNRYHLRFTGVNGNAFNTNFLVRGGMSADPSDYTKLSHLISLLTLSSIDIDFSKPISFDGVSVPSSDYISNSFDNVMDQALVSPKEINLPLDNWLYKTPAGDLLQVDTATGTLILDGVPYTGDVVYEYPPLGLVGGVNPTVENPTVTLDDVVVGNEPLVVEGDGVLNPPIEGDGEYQGILGRIATGVTSIVTLLTTGIVGSPEDINWDKLKMAGNVFTTQFPFSLPWDISRGLQAIFGGFVGDAELPEWKWEFNVFGMDARQEWVIKFPEMIVEWMPFIKAVMLIMFDLSLVYAVRKLLGGAS